MASVTAVTIVPAASAPGSRRSPGGSIQGRPMPAAVERRLTTAAEILIRTREVMEEVGQWLTAPTIPSSQALYTSVGRNAFRQFSAFLLGRIKQRKLIRWRSRDPAATGRREPKLRCDAHHYLSLPIGNR
jgi:hypothetical protein